MIMSEEFVEPLNVLLVDDDEDVQRIFEMVLAHHSHNLDICSDAESALVYLRDHRPDVVVMDIMLPGIDGYQAVEQIRNYALAPDCKLVATTSYYDQDTQRDVRNRGFDAYLPKPFDTKQLVAQLQQFRTA
jgi:CheY-like chemotaxis protein